MRRARVRGATAAKALGALALLLGLLLTSPASATIPDPLEPPRPLFEEAFLADLQALAGPAMPAEALAEPDPRGPPAKASPATSPPSVHLVAPSTWPFGGPVHPCRPVRSWRSTCVLGYPVSGLLQPLQIAVPEPLPAPDLVPSLERRGPENRIRGSNLALSAYISGSKRFKGEIASGLGEARFYDPDLGLFLSEDPAQGLAANPPSLHKYLYAFQNPTVYLDPSGRDNEEADGGPCFCRRTLTYNEKTNQWYYEDLDTGERTPVPRPQEDEAPKEEKSLGEEIVEDAKAVGSKVKKLLSNGKEALEEFSEIFDRGRENQRDEEDVLAGRNLTEQTKAAKEAVEAAKKIPEGFAEDALNADTMLSAGAGGVWLVRGGFKRLFEREALREAEENGWRVLDEGAEGSAKLRGPARQAVEPNLRELPTGVGRTAEENAQARAFYRNNRETAMRRWEERTGQQWPTDPETGRPQWAEHPRPLKEGGDPLYIEPGVGSDPNGPHSVPGPDGLTDHQRWGRMGPPARKKKAGY